MKKPMLQPNQFQINEAWIAFQLNDAPIRTMTDGDFNCVVLMDAASCFILASALVPISEAGPSKLEARRLLKEANARNQQLPKTLFVPRGQPMSGLALEAEHQEIDVVPVTEDELLPFIGEARQGFRERFGGGRVQ